MRLVSRIKLTRNHGADDWLITFATLVILAASAAGSAAVGLGYGKHIMDIPVEHRAAAVRGVVIQNSLLLQTFAWPKLAILALLRRLLDLRLLTTCILGFLCLSLVVMDFAASVIWYVQCSPIQHQWDQTVPGSCWNPSILQIFGSFIAAYSAFIDFVLALYPPFIIARLNMPRSKKVMTSLALGGGILAGIIASYKVTLLSGVNDQAKSDPTCTFRQKEILGSPESCMRRSC